MHAGNEDHKTFFTFFYHLVGQSSPSHSPPFWLGNIHMIYPSFYYHIHFLLLPFKSKILHPLHVAIIGVKICQVADVFLALVYNIPPPIARCYGLMHSLLCGILLVEDLISRK